VAGGTIPQRTAYYSWYWWGSDKNEDKGDKHVGIWSKQQSSREQSAENGNHTEDTHYGPAPVSQMTQGYI